jgi:hypothetical protein
MIADPEITAMKLHIVICSLLAAGGLQAASVTYSDTTTDTGGTVFFSTGPYTQIGDQIALAGTDRLAASATVQLFNNSDTPGTFDAMLRFFSVGSPVGAQLGGAFTLTGIPIANLSTATLTFGSLNSLLVPDNLIFTVAVSNVSAGLDLGLTMFEPPTIGSSDNNFFILYDGVSYTTGTQGNSQDNIYFSLTANPNVSPIPEPSTWVLASAGLVLAGCLKRRAKKEVTEPRLSASGSS